MFTFLKNIFVQTLITVGIMSSPVTVPQPIPNVPEPEPQIVVQEQVVEIPQSKPESPKVEKKTPEKIAEPQVSTPNINQVATPVVTTTKEPVKTPEKENAICGDSNNQTLSSKPTKDLCLNGNTGEVTESGVSYSWKCLGINGGENRSCSANKKVDAVCGSLINTIIDLSDYNQDNACSAGSVFNMKAVGTQISWDCVGYYGGEDKTCYAIRAITDEDRRKAQQ
jgi:hypothetical protein